MLAAYKTEVARLSAEAGYQTIDVIRITPDNPKKDELRTKFIDEHTHDEDEVRFFVEGSGAFYLHLADKVYQVVCTRDDLLSVPAGTQHWFDMGPEPYFTAIRLFISPDGWVAKFTGDKISSSIPRFDRAAGEGARLSMSGPKISAIVTDVEGTATRSPSSRRSSSPFARAHLADSSSKWAGPRVAALLAETRELAGRRKSIRGARWPLQDWIDADKKATP